MIQFGPRNNSCSDMKNVLILTSSLGNGHKIVARNLHNAFEKNPSINAYHVDILDHKSPLIAKVMNKAYVRLTKFDFPWAMFYLFANTAFFTTLKNFFVLFTFKKIVREVLEKTKPDIIISTWPGVDFPFIKEKKSKTKFYSVVTDIVSIPQYWINKGVDKYLVNDEKTKQNMIKLGADESKITVAGYPLPTEVLTKTPKDPDEIARKFNFKNYQGKTKILCLSGVAPKNKFLKILKELNKIEQDLFLIIINFKNHSLEKQINKIDFKHEYVHLDWTDDFYNLLEFSDIVLTKAGPGVVAESLFFHKYIALFHYIPGQEKGVKEYIIENDLGIYIDKPSEIKNIANHLPHKDRLHHSIRSYKKDQTTENGGFWSKENIEKYLFSI